MSSFINPLHSAPDPDVIAVATQVSRQLAKSLSSGRLVRNGKQGARFTVRLSEVLPEDTQLPLEAIELLQTILVEMGKGHPVSVIPAHAELTTQQAAELLGVSRPFLIQLLEDGLIPHRKVGTHRRVRTEEVVAYKQRVDDERRQALDDLAAEAQELDMGY